MAERILDVDEQAQTIVVHIPRAGISSGKEVLKRARAEAKIEADRQNCTVGQDYGVRQDAEGFTLSFELLPRGPR